MIDHQHVHRTSRRFEFESKLFLQRGEKGRTLGLTDATSNAGSSDCANAVSAAARTTLITNRPRVARFMSIRRIRRRPRWLVSIRARLLNPIDHDDVNRRAR